MGLNFEHYKKLDEFLLLNQEVRHCVQIYLDVNLNLSQAAKACYVHRNTLEYRFRMILDKTGVDLKEFEGAILAKSVLEGMRVPLYQVLLGISSDDTVWIAFDGRSEQKTVGEFLKEPEKLDNWFVKSCSMSVSGDVISIWAVM